MNQNREKEEDKDEKHRGPKRQRRNPLEIWPQIPLQEDTYFSSSPPKASPVEDTTPEAIGVFGNMNQDREKEEDKDEKYRGPKWHEVPDLPTQFEDKIMELQGSDVELVIQKELNKIDVSLMRSRLTVPDRQMKNDFLTSEERLRLEEKEPKRPSSKGLQVSLIDSSLHEWTITVKEIRPSDSCRYYALGGAWKEVVITNGLKLGNRIQLWSFRVNERPHLVLVNLENEREEKLIRVLQKRKNRQVQ